MTQKTNRTNSSEQTARLLADELRVVAEEQGFVLQNVPPEIYREALVRMGMLPAAADFFPGPWTHVRRSRDGHCDKIASGGVVFATVGSTHAEKPILDYPHENMQTATARLISKAPDMYVALKRVVIGEDTSHPDWYEGMAQDAHREASDLINEIDTPMAYSK